MLIMDTELSFSKAWRCSLRLVMFLTASWCLQGDFDSSQLYADDSEKAIRDVVVKGLTERQKSVPNVRFSLKGQCTWKAGTIPNPPTDVQGRPLPDLPNPTEEVTVDVTADICIDFIKGKYRLSHNSPRYNNLDRCVDQLKVLQVGSKNEVTSRILKNTSNSAKQGIAKQCPDIFVEKGVLHPPGPFDWTFLPIFAWHGSISSKAPHEIHSGKLMLDPRQSISALTLTGRETLGVEDCLVFRCDYAPNGSLKTDYWIDSDEFVLRRVLSSGVMPLAEISVSYERDVEGSLWPCYWSWSNFTSEGELSYLETIHVVDANASSCDESQFIIPIEEGMLVEEQIGGPNNMADEVKTDVYRLRNGKRESLINLPPMSQFSPRLWLLVANVFVLSGFAIAWTRHRRSEPENDNRSIASPPDSTD